METITQIIRAIQMILTVEADKMAQETKFVQRKRKVTGQGFAKMMVLGSMSEPEISYTDMSQDAALLGMEITAQGLAERFTPQSAAFMKSVLESCVQKVMTVMRPEVAPLLQRFTAVSIRDSTVIQLPTELKEIWPGTGGSQGETAALKLSVRFNQVSGEVEGPILQAGAEHDQKTPYRMTDLPSGALEIDDLGYFNLDDLQQADQQGVYWLFRLKQGTTVYDENEQRLEVLDWLQTKVATQAECNIHLGATHHIPCRLLARHLSPREVEERRRKLHEYARKKQVTLKAESLALAEWELVITNLPSELLSLSEGWVLLGIRWQVELLFKLWKDHAKVDEWRSHNPWRILTEIYAKLTALVLMHWIFRVQLWSSLDRSLFKAADAIQKLAISFALFLHDSYALHYLFMRIGKCFQIACRTNKRKAKPASFQKLSAAGALS